MVFAGKALRAAAMAWACVAACPAALGAGGAGQTTDFAGESASADARYVARWVVGTRDHKGLPFAIVDKKGARLFVFAASGLLVGAAPALLGLAPGDHSVPGIGQRDPSQIEPHERTTPAGRFVSSPGRNLSGEDLVWVDYESGLAIHRVRAGDARERRQQRLASATPHDNRVSLGCVIVAVAFYEAVVKPTLGTQRAVVYVLPETRPAREMFGASQADM
jgi:hypothetical protein